jgi:hypothetical protein
MRLWAGLAMSTATAHGALVLLPSVVVASFGGFS